MPKTTTHNAFFDFMGACDRTFKLFGGAYEEKDYPYAWTFETAAGPLYCHPIEDGAFCRFAHPERAKAIIGAGSLNPHSGKWNWHYNTPGLDELMDLQRHLAKVVKAPQLVDHMVKSYQEALGAIGSPDTDTILVYQYHDEATNTITGEVRLSGHPDTWDAGMQVRASLMLLDQTNGDVRFIPGQLGLPDLRTPPDECQTHVDPEVGHRWYSLLGMRPVRTDDPTGRPAPMSYDQFAKNVVKLTTGQGWDETYLEMSYAPTSRRRSERQAAA